MTGESESVRRENSKDLLVSVIIPVYQVSAYVERCLLSVMNQTYQNIECVIVDDCSTDDSIARCERLIETYEGPIKFRILHHERNRGLSAARNTGTNAVAGEYIFYLDSDDHITPNCIERLAKEVEADPAIEMVQGNSLMISDGSENALFRSGQPISISNNDEARKEFFQNRNIYISVWNRLLKKSFIEEHQLYCREGMAFEDLLWVYYLMKCLNKAYLCDEITHYYCLRQGSILVEAKPESVACYAYSFNEIFNNLTEGREQEELKGYLYYFIKRYVSYVKIAPALKDTIKLYKTRTKQYKCWYEYMVLFVTSIFGRLGNPSRVLEWMNRIRWKITKDNYKVE